MIARFADPALNFWQVPRQVTVTRDDRIETKQPPNNARGLQRSMPANDSGTRWRDNFAISLGTEAVVILVIDVL